MNIRELSIINDRTIFIVVLITRQLKIQVIVFGADAAPVYAALRFIMADTLLLIICYYAGIHKYQKQNIVGRIIPAQHQFVSNDFCFQLVQ